MAIADPIYISINNKPRAVLEVMDRLQTQSAQQQEAFYQRRLMPRHLFLAGLPFVAADWLLGYNCLTLSLVTAGLWGAGAVVGLALRRARPSGTFPPHFAAAREVIHTLRDDPDPRRNLFGHLDLSGARQPAKRFREGVNLRGLAMEYYRDEWLSLKARLYDGNMLRVAAIERVKVRKQYYKRSAISGKMKLKPAKAASTQQLKVRLSINPQEYEIVEKPSLRPGTVVGGYTVLQATTIGGIIDLTAGSSRVSIPASDVLSVLRLTYDQLQRKA
ncbi:MAG: hypothetical protein IT318_14040 [Anaerolineales bacterium]|nr:hypothetical protein [Anaerolineales bacterium]